MSEGQLLSCKKCGYEWKYKGKSRWYATCPRCLSKVKVAPLKDKVVDEHGR